MRYSKFIALPLLLILLFYPINAQPIKVEVIESYVMEVDVNENVHVKNVITLKNLIDKPLVPGIGELRLQKSSPKKVWVIPIPFTEERKAVDVKNVKAYTKDGRKINVRVEDKGDYTVIHYEIWYPIEPKKSFTFILEFDSPDLVEKGLLFKDTSIPVGADIDISNVEVKFKSDWYLVYLENTEGKIPANHIAFFTAEFSILPLPNVGFKWSIVFWLVVIITVTIIALVVAKRKRMEDAQTVQ